MKIRYAKNLIKGNVETQTGGTEGNQADLDVMKTNMIGDGSNGLTANDVEVGWEEEAIVSEWAKSFTDSLKTYSDKRKESYPPATDYLDGIVKGDQTQIDKYISDCLAIKEKFPKE
jgi:hypothetical protein